MKCNLKDSQVHKTNHTILTSITTGPMDSILHSMRFSSSIEDHYLIRFQSWALWLRLRWIFVIYRRILDSFLYPTIRYGICRSLPGDGTYHQHYRDLRNAYGACLSTKNKYYVCPSGVLKQNV